MKVTTENVIDLPIEEKDKMLLYSILGDLKEINLLNIDKPDLYINFQDWHNEYSPERTDPCPDYYGYYTLRYESNPYEIVGYEMTLNDLDYSMLLLNDFLKCNYTQVSNG